MAALAKASGLKEELTRTSQLLMEGALARCVLFPTIIAPAPSCSSCHPGCSEVLLHCGRVSLLREKFVYVVVIYLCPRYVFRSITSLDAMRTKSFPLSSTSKVDLLVGPFDFKLKLHRLVIQQQHMCYAGGQ